MSAAERRVVVDTSVILSSVLGDPEAAPARVMRAMYAGVFQAYSSREVLDELYRVLFSERVARLLRGRGEVAALTYVLVNSSVTLVDPKRRVTLCRDPEDDKFLEVAYEAKADCIVTLDEDLLDVRDEETKEASIFEHKVKILKPEEFLRQLQASLEG